MVEKFINFIDILAWILAIISTLFVMGRSLAYIFYNKLDRLRDKMNGVHASFPIINGGILAVICWTWIIAGWLP